jgi:D-alanyl-D-alanine carboxypeptidase (penicillin-binding protein 5/6)
MSQTVSLPVRLDPVGMPLSRRATQLLPIVFLVGCLLLAVLALLLIASVRLPLPGAGAGAGSGSATVAEQHPSWPRSGQAAVSVGAGTAVLTPGPESAVPIASVTKIMTALVVLEQAPLAAGDDGFELSIGVADVEDTERRRARSESVVAVRAGDRISQREALLALLLPSANNMAHLLAVKIAGSEPAFVDLMNERARSMRLDRTTYADASGFDRGSRSTARDQTVLARAAMENPTFVWLVRQQLASLPTIGQVVTTNRLLGRHGFVGVKTGSTTPAGGCFVFAAQREVGGERRLVVGAVLGQRGTDPVRAAFDGGELLVDSVTDPIR